VALASGESLEARLLADIPWASTGKGRGPGRGVRPCHSLSPNIPGGARFARGGRAPSDGGRRPPKARLRGGPVSRVLSGVAPRMTIPLDLRLPAGLKLPTRASGVRRPCGRYRRTDHDRARPLFGIAPGGACHAGPVARPAVGFYPTVSPLPVHARAVSFSVALSLGLPQPGVTRHRCLPGARTFLGALPRGRPALRANPGYGVAARRSTGKRRARSSASAASVVSAGPCAHGRKRRRKAARRVASGRAGS